MAWFTSAELDDFIGSGTRAALDGSDTDTFDQFEAQARATVQSVLISQGYTVGTTTTNTFVKMLAMGQWYLFAASTRKGIEMPESVKQIIGMLNAVFEGRLPIPGLTPSAADGVGGVKASSSSETSDVGRPPRMKRSDLRGW